MDHMPLIVRSSSREVVITGDVACDPSRSASFETPESKMFGVFADNAPFPVGPQLVTYTIRVTEHPAKEESPQVDVIVRGDIHDRVRKGDMVQIVAVEQRRILGTINLFNLVGTCVGYEAIPGNVRNYSTVLLKGDKMVESPVVPDATISPATVQLFPVVVLFVVLSFLVWLALGGASILVDIVASALLALLIAVADVLGAVLYALGPSLIALLGIAMLIKSMMS